MRTVIRPFYLALMATLTVLYYTLPDAPWFIWTMIGCTSVVAIVTGIVVNRPRPALPWWFVAAGTFTFIGGDTMYALLTGPMGMDNPFPSAADGLYLVTYPLFAIGLLLFVRSRSLGRDREALLDALVVTIGVGLIAWVFLAAPYVRDSTLTAEVKAFSIAYPLGDVLLMAVLARLLIGRGQRSWSLRALTVGTVCLLVTDAIYGVIQLNGTWKLGGPVDLGWICFYTAWGAAALEPDMVHLGDPAPPTPTATSTRRLLLLGSVSLLPPIVLLYEGLAHSVDDVVVIAFASGAIFLIVTLRLSGLVQAARHATRRESVLRRTGEALVGTTSRREIYAVGVEAVSAIAGSADPLRVLVAVGAGGASSRIVYDSATPDAIEPISTEETRANVQAGSVIEAGSPARLGSTVGMGCADLVQRYAPELAEHSFVLTVSGRVEELVPAGLGPATPVLLAGLARSGSVTGLLAICGVSLRGEVIDSVCAMAAQMALAIESADLTEQVLQRKSEARFRSLIQNTSDMILILGPELDVIYQTPSVEVILGHLPDQVIGLPLLDLVSEQDSLRASSFLRRVRSTSQDSRSPTAGSEDPWRLVDANGGVRAFEVTCTNMMDDPFVQGLVVTLHDTTEQYALEEELKHLAFHDSLTQLPNRILFLDRVEHALSWQGRHRERLAVMLIDLDDFKTVNDTRGHAVGDALLVAVSERLQHTLRPSDTCARLGGDEFAVLLEGLGDDDEEASQLAERIQATLRLPFSIGDEQISIRASIGVSTSDTGVQAAKLLVQADLAMYAAKDAGKGSHEFYQPSLQHVMQSRLNKTKELAVALREDQFILLYQPIVDLGTGRVRGTEALVRWQHPTRGLVLPSEFIEAVEVGELAIPLGRWVLETAIAQAAAWKQLGPVTEMRMSINVAPRQLSDPGFVDTVTESLTRNGLAPHLLTLEITERTLTAQEPQIERAMAGLERLGVGLAIDDFGTGYAALAYLRRFPVTTLKIDRSFITGVDKSKDQRSLVKAIISLGEAFELTVVAEGIETSSQRDALVAMGCDLGQGFLYAGALPAPAVVRYVSDIPAPTAAEEAALALTPRTYGVPLA